MWCHRCQQEVPAIAPAVAGPLVCPRCELILSEAKRVEQLEDTGIELTEFDTPRIVPLRDVFDSKQVQAELAHLGRRLASTSRMATDDLSPALQLVRKPLEAQHSVPPRTSRALATYPQQRTATGWWLCTLLLLSGVTLACGFAALLWSSVGDATTTYHQALTATLLGEGGLIIGLAWMATRLWRNSRHVNRQLAGVDRQLDALKFATEQRPGYDSAYYRRVA